MRLTSHGGIGQVAAAKDNDLGGRRMKKFLFVAGLAFGWLAYVGPVSAQDEPAADPAAEPAADPTAEGGGEAGMEAGGEGTETTPGEGTDEAAPPKQMRFGVGAVLAFPVAGEASTGTDWSDLMGIGIGAAGHLMYMLSPKLALAGTLGLVYHLPKDLGGVDVTVMEIPILAGVRFMVAPKIAVGGDTGVNLMKVSLSDSACDSAGDACDMKTRIPLRLGGDFFISQSLVAGAGIWISNLLLRDSDVEEGMAIQIEGHIGYMF